MRLAGEAKEIGDQSCVMPDGEAGTRSQLGAGSGAVSPIGANNAGRSAADQALAALGCYRRQATDIDTPLRRAASASPSYRIQGVREFLIIASTCRSFPSIPLAVSSAGRGASSEALAFFLRKLMRTIVYVDGFNLYYGALKGSSRKWLDLVALFEKVLQPHHEILAIEYFAARVSGTTSDPSKPQRQDIYFRALRRFRPQVEIYFGHFLSHTVRAPLAEPIGNLRTAQVIGTGEKAQTSISQCICSTIAGWTLTTARSL